MPEPEIPVSPRFGLIFLTMPILMISVLVGGYALVMVLGARGRPADGQRVALAFEGCDKAEAVVRARVGEMGLGDPVWSDRPGGFGLVATLPDWDGAAARISATLVQPGALRIEQEGEVLLTNDAIASATVRLDYTTSATTAIVLSEGATATLQAFADTHPTGTKLQVVLDDAPIASLATEPEASLERFDLLPFTGDRAENIREVAAWAVVLNNGVLPCPLTVGPTESL